MRDNIMFYPAIALMIVEAAAAVFLIWAWRKAKGKRCKKEWNILYSIFDGIDRKVDTYICLPSFWKVLWWFVRKGRKACEMNIWVSGRLADDEGVDDDIWEV